MRSIIKNRVVLFFVLITFVLAIYNVRQYQSFKGANSLDMENERKNFDEIELKTSGDNDYIKEWDS